MLAWSSTSMEPAAQWPVVGALIVTVLFTQPILSTPMFWHSTTVDMESLPAPQAKRESSQMLLPLLIGLSEQQAFLLSGL